MTLPDWQPTVYYFEGVVDATLERAWELLVDYRAYNPTFVGATVTHVSGEPGGEGELAVIDKVDHGDGAAPPFYCLTAKLVPQSHIVWYIYDGDGSDTLRNFVDFGLREADGVVTFSINYYAQGRLSPDELRADRELLSGFLPDLVGVFQRHVAASA